MLIKSTKGITFVETAVSVGLLSIAAFAIASTVLSQKKMYYEVRKREVLKEVISQNMLEFNAKPISSLPAIDSCLVRTYDNKGNFIQEQIVELLNNICKQTDLKQEELIVTMKVTGAKNINVTFVPDKFLKLPKFSNSVRQIEVTGLMYVRNNILNKPLVVTLYRREGP